MKKFCDIILVTFDFFIISLKIHNLAKSRNFRSPILKVKERWRGARGAEPLALGDF